VLDAIVVAAGRPWDPYSGRPAAGVETPGRYRVNFTGGRLSPKGIFLALIVGKIVQIISKQSAD
jgi:hypothetical protein